MSVAQISERLIELLRKRAFIEALEELYDEKANSLEPDFHPNRETKGLEVLLKKEKFFLSGIQSWEEFHISDALVAKDHFSIRMYSKLILKSNTTLEIDEIIVYQVNHGKIIHETYFYDLS